MMRCGDQASRGPRSTLAAVLCAFVVFCAFHAPVQAQQVGSAVNPAAPKEASSAPGTLRLDYSQTPVALQIGLPDADAAIKQSIAQEGANWPLQIGEHRALPEEFQSDLTPQLDWEEMGDGSIVSSLSVTSPDATAMRMAVQAELPDGGEIRFFDGQSNQGPGSSGYPVIDAMDFAPGKGAPETLGASTADSGDEVFRRTNAGPERRPGRGPGHGRQRDLRALAPGSVRIRQQRVGAVRRRAPHRSTLRRKLRV